MEENPFPLIDISKFTKENEEEVALQIRASLMDSGFFLVSNHGINVGEVLSVGRKFFELDSSEKEKFKLNESGRGTSNIQIVEIRKHSGFS